MKLNLESMKLIIRMLILLILLVMLFIISAFLYTARYWPDVYTYINANITIKRIPTISELNLTVIYEIDGTTESYSTTDIMDYTETVDDFGFNFDDFIDEVKVAKRQIPIEETVDSFGLEKVYDSGFHFEMTTELMNDLVNEDRLATNMKDVEMIEKHDKVKRGILLEIIKNVIQNHEVLDNKGNETGVETVFPWIAALFIKNDGNDQFEYICDGALLSKKAIITAARCVTNTNGTVLAENMLVILGKRSLYNSGDKEKVVRVNNIVVHENFSTEGDNANNDLAIIMIEEVTFQDSIKPAVIKFEDNATIIATTGWPASGELKAIFFDKEKSKTCEKSTKAENTFCATFGNDITTCSSFGGLYLSKTTEWSLLGISTGVPKNKGLCVEKSVTFTNLYSYQQWIEHSIK